MFLAALTIGLLSSFHCIGMCGPIALALPLGSGSTGQKALNSFLYNTGRILTYAILGAVFGVLGMGASLFGAQQWLSIAIGVFIIVMAVLPNVKFESQSWVMKLTRPLKNALGKLFKTRKRGGLFLIGLLNGLLPCGMIYFALAGALATGQVWEGAVFMAIFGLGTLPVMFAVPLMGQFIKPKMREKVRKAVPYIAVFIGILFIIRGLGLGIPYLSPKIEKCTNEVSCCH